MILLRDRLVGEEVYFVCLKRSPARRPSCDGVGDPRRVAREPVRQDQDSGVRLPGGEGVPGNGYEVVPIVRDENATVGGGRCPLLAVRLPEPACFAHADDIEPQLAADLGGQPGHVFIKVESRRRNIGFRQGSSLRRYAGRVNGSSSYSRSGVHSASSASRSSISFGYTV